MRIKPLCIKLILKKPKAFAFHLISAEQLYLHKRAKVRKGEEIAEYNYITQDAGARGIYCYMEILMCVCVCVYWRPQRGGKKLFIKRLRRASCALFASYFPPKVIPSWASFGCS